MLMTIGLTLVAVIAATGRAQEEVVVRDLRDSEAYDHSLCRRLAGLESLPKRHGVWPRPQDPDQELRGGVTLVALVDGLLVGRAILEAPYQPYCELVNLCVRPDYRGRGVATAIVRESIRRAREMGSKYMVLQECLEDTQARGIYEKAGFLNATVGEMQRLIHLLDVPLVSAFLQDHPDAEFVSEPATDFGERWWRLRWEADREHVTLYLHGGSCQSDSDGFQPVVQACEFARGDLALSARVDMPKTVSRGELGQYRSPQRGLADLTVTVHNPGRTKFHGAIRAVLLPDTEPVSEFAAAAPQIELEPGDTATVRLPIRVRPEFRCEGQRFNSYPSAPFTAEICWEGGSILLSAAVRVE